MVALFSPILKLKTRLNHGLARIDAAEKVEKAVAGAAPIKRRIAPLMGLGLGAAVLTYNVRQAPTPEQKRKTLIRDGLVLAGVGAASLVSVRYNKGAAEKILKLLGKTAHDHATCGHFAHTAQERVQSLFKSSMHDHGWEGAIRMTFQALVTILGGGVAGTVADALNGEDWKRSSAMKLKEGLFQFLGNITMCTVSILAFNKLARTGFQALWHAGPLRKSLVGRTEAMLKSLLEKPVNDLALIPAKLTEKVQQVLIEQAGDRKELLHQLEHQVEHIYEDSWKGVGGGLAQRWESTVKPRLEALLNKEGPVDQNGVHQAVREFFAEQLQQDIRPMLQKPDTVAEIARNRYQTWGELVGVVAGVFGGVVGGAWVSNQVNGLLTKVFHLPEGHQMTGFFQHGHGRKKENSSEPSPAKSQGWLAGKVGERGIHWYDGILHLDDYPSALYMAGVEMMESLVQVLYGMSAFLTGTAGTNYLEAAPEQSLEKPPAGAPQHLGAHQQLQLPAGEMNAFVMPASASQFTYLPPPIVGLGTPHQTFLHEASLRSF